LTITGALLTSPGAVSQSVGEGFPPYLNARDFKGIS
jgi:hypothetical protein